MPELENQMAACADMIGRTGAKTFELKHFPDQEPPFWLAIGTWPHRSEVAAGMSPLIAMTRLCEDVIDGGMCAKCKKPTGITFETDFMPFDKEICWYQYDPSTKKFQRGCA